MNSFNHYTFGGCGKWMMGWLVGRGAESAGFKTVRIEPTTISGLDFASGSFQSPYGIVSNRWQRKDGHITMHLIIPPNGNAFVVLPAQAKDVTFAGKPVSPPPAGGLGIGSGTREFTWAEEA